MLPSLTDPKIGPSGPGVGIDELELKATVAELLNCHPDVGLAVGVIRDGYLEIIERAGHNPQSEQPDEVMEAVGDFLSEAAIPQAR